jgi:uncharacterized cupin superfamily protein
MTAQTSTEQATWFAIHCDDAPWQGTPLHAYVDLQAVGGEGSFRQYGISVDVNEPGSGNCYHYEAHEDESFLVLDGEFDLVIEGELHRVRAGDFIHCPRGTAHVFVGAGERPAAIMMLGRRGLSAPGRFDGEYLPDPHAARLGVSVDEPTSDPKIAYAGRPEYGPVECPQPWALDRTPREASPFRRGETGWFILDVGGSDGWFDNGRTARFLMEPLAEDWQYGVNIQVMRPGEPNCRYHREFTCDETMLVLDGEAIVIAEGEERRVTAGTFIHFPAGTAHVMVGAGDAPCAVLMVGTRDESQSDPERWGEYPVDAVAAKYGASVSEHTRDADVAYADRPSFVATETPPWRWH